MTIELLGDDCMSMVIGCLHDPVSVCSLMATSQRLASLVRSNEASEALLRSSWLTRLQDLRVLEGGVGVGDEGGGEGGVNGNGARLGFPRVTRLLQASHRRAAGMSGDNQDELLVILDGVLQATLRYQGDPSPAPAEHVQELASACGLALASVGVSHLGVGVMSWMVQGLVNEEAGWVQAWSDWGDWCVDSDALLEASVPEHGSTITDAFVQATYGL